MSLTEEQYDSEEQYQVDLIRLRNLGSYVKGVICSSGRASDGPVFGAATRLTSEIRSLLEDEGLVSPDYRTRGSVFTEWTTEDEWSPKGSE